MKDESDTRCSPELVIRSVVDGDDLDERRKVHLERCPECRRERDRLAGRLERLGNLAAEMTPAPRRRAALPLKDRARPVCGLFGPRLAWVSAGVCTLVVLAVAWTVFQGSGVPAGRTDLALETARDEVLMAEIEILEENPLSETCREISPEDSSGLDEEIYEFIIPTESRDPDRESETKEV